VNSTLARPAGERRRDGMLMAGLAFGALLVAVYLAAVKLSGGSPVCGPLAGCDTVNSSIYSEVMGVPVALFGALASAGVLAAAFWWWYRGARWALLTAYLIGLASLPALAYLTYLELFVIGAICVWCVAYALLVIGGWLVATAALLGQRRTPAPPS
jgi:uncharacterized membrane protein